ncbi:MAG: hypothetical protein JXR84_21255 [Anaerolineae bacterium]|nr:hypothetical protein [Anaerolineae bacterium]
MPFAKKFRAMMDFPFPGDTVEDFTIESVDLWDEQSSSEGHIYGVRMVLHGVGGKQGIKRALNALFSQHPVTFSGYGNPYQLWFRKSEIESLGDKRYAVSVKGAGERIYLEPELVRFLQYLNKNDHLTTPPDSAIQETLVEDYLEQYRAEIGLQVGRYRRKLAKATRN